jgi:hypothetical protein
MSAGPSASIGRKPRTPPRALSEALEICRRLSIHVAERLATIG